MNTKDIGDVSEAKALTRLKQLEYNVFLPFGDNSRSDMIAEKSNGKTYKLQVKTGRLKQEERVITFRTDSIYQIDGENIRDQYTEAQIDAFIVYVPQLDELYWVDIEDCGKGTTYLRRKSKQNQPSIKWAENYTL